MSLSARIDKLEAKRSGGDDEFVEAVAQRTGWLPDGEFWAIREMVGAALAGEDIETTRPDELAALNSIIAEVQVDFAEAG